MDIWFGLAGLSALFTALIHTFVGQKPIEQPLLTAPKFDHIACYTHYYCWHIVTIVLFSMGVMFIVAAQNPQSNELAWVASIYATLFLIWNWLMIARKGLKLKHFLQWALFIPTAGLGWAGLLF